MSTNDQLRWEEADLDNLIDTISEKLEKLAVILYNKMDYSSSFRLCRILMELYEGFEKSDEIKRIQKIIKKLNLINEYMESNKELIDRQKREKAFWEKSQNK